MSTTRRQRGRPRGSGKDDSAPLAKVADMMVHNPSLKPTTAMRRVLRDCDHRGEATDPTLLRRWQGKWKADRNSLLAAARDRARPRSAPVPVDIPGFAWGDAMMALRETGSAWGDAMKAIRENGSALGDAMMALRENGSEAMKVLRELQNLPGLQRMIGNEQAIQR